MLKLIQKIRTMTETGAILEHMELFDILEANAKVLLKHDDMVRGFNVVADEVHEFEIKFMSREIEKMETKEGDYYELLTLD